MRNRTLKIFLFCGAVFTLAASTVFAQQNDNRIPVNRKPLIDLAESVNDKLAKKEIDLNAEFSLETNVVLAPDGKFDNKLSRFGKRSGDEKMVEVARTAVEAVGNSGVFAYLKNSGVEKFTLTIGQDVKTLTARMVMELPTSNKGKTLASGLNLLLTFAKKEAKIADEKTLLNASSVASNDKQVILTFALAKEIYQEMLSRELKKIEEKRSSPISNS